MHAKLVRTNKKNLVPGVCSLSSASTRSNTILTRCLMAAAAVLLVVLSLVKCSLRHNTIAYEQMWKQVMSCEGKKCTAQQVTVQKYCTELENTMLRQRRFFLFTNALSYIYKHNYRAQTNILNIHKNNKHVEIRKRTIVHVCGFVHVA